MDPSLNQTDERLPSSLCGPVTLMGQSLGDVCALWHPSLPSSPFSKSFLEENSLLRHHVLKQEEQRGLQFLYEFLHCFGGNSGVLKSLHHPGIC